MNVLTVNGFIDADDLGKTLMHEHLVFDFRDYFEAPPTAEQMSMAQLPVSLETLSTLRFDPFKLLDNLLHKDRDLTIQELRSFSALGGKTIVDPTNVSIGRDPSALQEISRVSGLNIVMGAGYYFEISLGPEFQKKSMSDVRKEIVHDITHGIRDTGVKAGLIGEIGTSAPITENEEKSLRASAQAQAETGAPLMIHLNGWFREGNRVLDIIEDEGGKSERTILCHMNPSWMDLEYQKSLGDRGAFLEYDMMGMIYEYPPNKQCPDDSATVQAIKHLIDAGYRDRILMSQDVFLKSQFQRYGGLGFVHVFTSLQNQYDRVGMTANDLNHIFVENPKRAISFFEN